MKKILIVNSNMNIGGVQKALVSLLWNISDQYEVTLLLFAGVGECMKDIPPGVHVITVTSDYRYLGMTGSQAVTLGDQLGRSFYAAITRCFGRSCAVALMGLGQKTIDGYDIAISYLHDAGEKLFYGGCNDFVGKHVAAPKKITFLHCDYLRCGADTPQNRKRYPQFDVIAACSQGCADRFLQANPHLHSKVQIVPNCHRFQQIRKLAEAEPIYLPEGRIHVVTVARLGKEKGVGRAIRAIARMGVGRERLHYYIIGDGVERKKLLSLVKRERLENCVTFCGMLPNPYGYIQAADLLLIPSHSEAAPMVIGEAICLGTPILSTQTSSAREMIEGENAGWVCENTEEGLCQMLKTLTAEPSLLREAKEALSRREVSNDRAVSSFVEMVEEGGKGGNRNS